MPQLFSVCCKDSSQGVHRAEVLQGREVLPGSEFRLISWASPQEGGCQQKGSHFLSPSAGCRHWALPEEGAAFGDLLPLPLRAVALRSTMPRPVEKAFPRLTGKEGKSTEHGGGQVNSELPDSGRCPLETSGPGMGSVYSFWPPQHLSRMVPSVYCPSPQGFLCFLRAGNILLHSLPDSVHV